MKNAKPIQPVAPEGMEILFFYPCPKCKRHIPIGSPTQPSMVRCEHCHTPFPILPIDERSIHYINIMLGHGRAAIDPDFM